MNISKKQEIQELAKLVTEYNNKTNLTTENATLIRANPTKVIYVSTKPFWFC
jgi:hypothetical protein